MPHTTMILSVLLTMVMLIYMAPSVMAMNRGNIFRNIALWLAVFLALALFYKGFGPDSPHPLFQQPYSLSGMRPLTQNPLNNGPQERKSAIAPNTEK